MWTATFRNKASNIWENTAAPATSRIHTLEQLLYVDRYVRWCWSGNYDSLVR